MKNFTTIVLLLFATVAALAQPTVNFEASGAGAGYTWAVFENGDNPPLEIIANPSLSGINTSATVAKFTARLGGQPYAGVESYRPAGENPTPSVPDISPFVFSSTNSTVKVMVYKTVISDVGLKFVTSSAASSQELKKPNTKTNEWEEITFDFSTDNFQGGREYNQVVVFPDFNGRTQETISYFDNITFSSVGGGGGGSNLPALPLDFESSTIPYTFSDFGGGAATVVDNPQTTGNSSAKVGRMVKNDGQVYGGSLISLGAPIDFSTNKTFKVKVFMPRVGATLLLKVENQTVDNINFEKSATGTIANAWEELTFDYSAINTANQYQKVVLIFDLGTVGNGSADFTYLFDDIRLLPAGGGGSSGIPPTITFEDSGAGASYTWNVFNNGANPPPLEIVNNPFQSGINTSAKVAKFTAKAMTDDSAGTETAHGSFGTFDFSASNSTVKIMVYKSVISDVGLKFAIAGGGSQGEKKVANTKVNEWEELTFDFSNLIPGSVPLDGTINISQIIVFPDFKGGRAQDNVCYFDNITFSARSTPPPPNLPTLPLDFESTTIPYAFTDFDGGAMTVVANPNSGGINTSANVAKMVKNAGQPWGGSLLGLAAPIDFSTNKIFKAKIYSPREGAKVLLKVENQTDNGINFQKEVLTTVANTWEELSFDYSAIDVTKSYQKIVFIFDNGTVGDGSANFTFFVDDVKLVASSTPPPNLPTLPLDFESATIPYAFTDFGGGAMTVVANPNSGGINTSANVAKMVKNAGEVYGGSWLGLAAPIDFSTNKVFKAKIYSPRIGAKVLLKVENQTTPAINFEKEVLTTVANTWEELSFDYSAIDVTKSYQKVAFIFDNGTPGDGSANFTFLVDDVKLVASATPPPNLPILPLDFESTSIPYAFTDFGGGAMTVVANPNSGGINTSANVARTVKNAGEVYGGSWLGLAAPINFSTNKLFKAKIYSPRVGAKVLLKVENQDSGDISFQKEAETTVANAWEELSFDYSAIDVTKSYQKIVFIFDNGTVGDGSPNFTFLVDDVKLVASSTPPPNLPTLPLDFESTTIPYAFTDFGGGEMTVVANPNSGGINTSANVAKMVKNAGEVYGGSWLGLAAPINFSTNKLFKAKIYSSRVGAKVLLKVENQGNGDISFQKEAETTVANTWEELSFDYSAIDVTKSYQKIIFIFDNGTVGDGSANFTFLVDDVTLVAGSGTTLTQMTLPVTFDDASVNYGLAGFGGAEASSIETDPTLSTNKVAKVVKSATAETWAGTTVTAMNGLVQTGFSTKIPFTATNAKMNVRVWAPNAGIKIRLKVEDHLDDKKSVETEVTNTVANEWETLTFDFTAQATGTAALNLSFNYNKASIFFNFDVGGASAGEKTYYFDDLKFGEQTLGSQTITFPAIADKLLADLAFQLTATASSNLAVAYSTESDKVTISGSTATIVKAGRVVIKANQAGNASFSAAPEVTQAFCIKPAKPTITITTPTPGTSQLSSNATAGNQWFKDGVAIAGATNQTLSVTDPGVYKVRVAVDDCISEFSADTPIGGAVANQTITFPAITDKTVGDAAFALTATATSALAVGYSPDSDKVTISGSTVTIVKAGRVTIKANQAGNSSFNAAPEVTRTFCIKPKKPVITTTNSNAETITLTSSEPLGNTWFLDGVAIVPAATNQTLSADKPGVYSVRATVDDCRSDISTDFPLIVTGDVAGASNRVAAYPSPAEEYVVLAGINGELSNVQLIDLAGRRNSIGFEKRGEVYQANVQHLTLGIYLLQVQDATATHRIKIIKK